MQINSDSNLFKQNNSYFVRLPNIFDNNEYEIIKSNQLYNSAGLLNNDIGLETNKLKNVNLSKVGVNIEISKDSLLYSLNEQLNFLSEDLETEYGQQNNELKDINNPNNISKSNIKGKFIIFNFIL